jgi:hypothetical protein
MFGIFADHHRFHLETVHHAFQLGRVKKSNCGDTADLRNYSDTINPACEWAVVRVRHSSRFGIKGGDNIDLAGTVHIHADERAVKCGGIGIRKGYRTERTEADRFSQSAQLASGAATQQTATRRDGHQSLP